MEFLKKHWSNILFVVLIALLLIPQTGKPIKIFVHRLISSSPSTVSEDKRNQLNDYQWSLLDEQGQRVDLLEFRGKVILLNEWATWCPPCIAEMPSLQELYSDYKEDVVFLFVSNEAPEKLKGFKQAKGLDIPVYTALEAAPEQLSSQSIPATFLIDKDGEIVIKKIGAADWNSSKVRNLLDALK